MDLDLNTAIACFKAAIEAAPLAASVLKAAAELFARRNGLDPVKLIVGISADTHEQIDRIVDAEIEAASYPTGAK
jgi:acetamidase/formamidase